MSTGRTLEGAGSVTWWGFGPARDLLETGVLRPRGEVNVLLVGSSDPRHILKTISGLKDTDSLHVWVIENSMEVVARQLLLLYVSLSAAESMGMQEKTEVFLELFGNSEIRSETGNKLKHVAARLSLLVTDSMDADTCAHPCLDTSLLRFKERDELTRIFKQWQNPPSSPPSMAKAWDARVREHLGTRYDARKGCFDWDLTMKLHERRCGVIHKEQYSRWRESGVAFELREGLYSIANQSLLSTRTFNHKGNWVGVRGYWGDIISSPYLSFGVDTENKELLKTQNNQHVKTAQDVSVANVQALFKSLSTRGGHTDVSQLHKETGSPPDLSGLCEPASVSGNEKEEEPDEGTHAGAGEGQNHTHHPPELMNLRGVSVSFLSPDSLPKLFAKTRYRRLFSAIYCSASMVHHLDSCLTETAAPDAVLMVELARYLLDLRKEQQASFTTRVCEIAKELGFVPVGAQGGDEHTDAYAVFRLEKDS